MSEPITVIDVLTLLPIPALASDLTKWQINGQACVWCGVRLHGETAVDFGRRSGTYTGVVSAWFPRGCQKCVSKAANEVYSSHPGDCEQCADDPTQCAVRHALRQFALEVRS